MSATNCLRVALVQMAIGPNKSENLKKAAAMITTAKEKGSQLVILPECFNSPYGTKYFEYYAEEVPEGETCRALSLAAKCNDIYLVGGSIPERKCEKLYNTCTVWDPRGDLIACHRKVHLFDIDIPGGIKFQESEVLSAGPRLSVVQVGSWKIGIGICYDVRFGEMAAVYRKRGVDMLIYPGAFNMTTGPLHWELLMRARAADNQVFVAGVCGAQDPKAEYVAWGHSTMIDPWGKVLVKAGFNEITLYADINLEECERVRLQIPTMKQRRGDLYDTLDKKPAFFKEDPDS